MKTWTTFEQFDGDTRGLLCPTCSGKHREEPDCIPVRDVDASRGCDGCGATKEEV